MAAFMEDSQFGRYHAAFSDAAKAADACGEGLSSRGKAIRDAKSSLKLMKMELRLMGGEPKAQAQALYQGSAGTLDRLMRQSVVASHSVMDQTHATSLTSLSRLQEAKQVRPYVL